MRTPTSTLLAVAIMAVSSAPIARSAAGAPATGSSTLTPAVIENDEGGPVVVVGEWRYAAANVGAHYLEPVAVLLNVSREIRRDGAEWVPRDGQVMGTLTRPLAPAPTAYRVDLPIRPGGPDVDFGSVGPTDAGLRVYAALLGTNLVGDSYLEQFEQAGFRSYLTDPVTGAVREGTFLVFSPDGSRGFPGDAGRDGVFFTADDPLVAVPAGYTLATLSRDGRVRFDRSRTATMAIRERAAYASPDFSRQGILESYHSLVDMLSVRYSYTELRRLDWKKIRRDYLPRVEAAEKAGDFKAFYATMRDLALSIRDAHVYVGSADAGLRVAGIVGLMEATKGNLGVRAVEMNDGRFVVVHALPNRPGAEAGWGFGTEIVRVDGEPVGQRIARMPLMDSAGNPEVIRLAQANLALSFPVGTKTRIEYRQPGDAALRTVTLTATEGDLGAPSGPATDPADISFKDLDGVPYIQWKMFDDPLYKMAIWEKFLSRAQGAQGIVIDMRNNGGGATDLLYTMASYLFPPERPARYRWLDYYTYDEVAGRLVKEFAIDYPLSSPRSELTFTGAVAVLVDKGSASAAEYLPQFLQRHGRAIVVGEHGTEGAGGYLERAAMPGGFTFYFTKGRTVFAGTNEYNLEAKGVALDVRVPVTEENERAKQKGRDVVLEAAVSALGKEAARLAAERMPGTTWRLVQLSETAKLAKHTVGNPDDYTIAFGKDGVLQIRADCNRAQAGYTFGEAGKLTVELGPATMALCKDGSLGERFLQALGKAASFQTDGKAMVITAEAEGGPVILLLEIVK